MLLILVVIIYWFATIGIWSRFLLTYSVPGGSKMYFIELLGYFPLWTLLIYCTHRLAHSIPALWHFHQAHHAVSYDGKWEFSWWNLIGWFNDWRSTLDQWLTEIIPTILYILLFHDAWPIAVLYYIDSFLSEGITDHNPRIAVPGLAMGRYHLAHHADMTMNFDLYTHFWDWVFGTRHHVV